MCVNFASGQSSMRYLSKCLVCRSQKLELLYESTFSGLPKDAPVYFLKNRSKVAHGQITRCTACGFSCTNPQFDVDEYRQIYAAVPRLTPENNPVAEAEKIRFKRLVKLVSRYIAHPHRLLDLGCGDAKFLSMMPADERFGYEVADGNTIAEANVHILTGNFLSRIGDFPLVEGSFDAITAWDVFEHLPDLYEYVEAIGRLLRPKGYLFVTVPNANSLIARLSGKHWNMLLLEHLWYFSPKTLDHFLSIHDFFMVKTGHIPFDVTITHLTNRFAQTYALNFSCVPRLIGDQVISLPVGLMYAVYQRQ